MDDCLGHKIPGCPGQWIDVSTLTESQRQMCTVCRGTRINRDGEEENAHDLGPPHPELIPSRWRYAPTPFFILFLLALFMAFVLGHFLGSRP